MTGYTYSTLFMNRIGWGLENSYITISTSNSLLTVGFVSNMLNNWKRLDSVKKRRYQIKCT